jgi:hypothetical protein
VCAERVNMRVFWWNGGLHVEPETESERAGCSRSLMRRG